MFNLYDDYGTSSCNYCSEEVGVALYRSCAGKINLLATCQTFVLSDAEITIIRVTDYEAYTTI